MTSERALTATTTIDPDKALKKAAKKMRKAQEALEAANALEAEAKAAVATKAREASQQKTSEPYTIPGRLEETTNGVLVLYTQEEAAAHLKVSPRTLEGWRFKNTEGAPRFVKQFGRVRYLGRDLNEYIRSLEGNREEGAA